MACSTLLIATGLAALSVAACQGAGAPTVQSSGGAGGAGTGGARASGGAPASGGSQGPGGGGTFGGGAGNPDGGAGGAGGTSTPTYLPVPVKTWGGQPLDMVPFASSGTRLSAIGYSDDAAVFFDTMRDTQLGIDCLFEASEPGAWLCSPKPKVDVLYLDADCKAPATPGQVKTGDLVGGVRSSGSSPSGGADTFIATEHTPVYRVAEMVYKGVEAGPGDYQVYAFNSSSKTCVSTEPRLAKGAPSIFRLTAIADTELVKATARDVRLQGGLVLERLVTADGAEMSGNLKTDGQRCDLQLDGRCAPTPLAAKGEFVDPACTEQAYFLSSIAPTMTTVYAVEATLDQSSKVYQLSPISSLYFQTTRIDTVTEDGVPMHIPVVTGCQAEDRFVTTSGFYRVAQDITDRLPKVDHVQLGGAILFPSWFVGVVAGNQAQIQLQIHSPDWNWIKPNIRTSGRTVCSVYDDRWKDQCLCKDGATFLPVKEVKL